MACQMFCSSHFSFLVTFVFILEGKMGKTEKNQKENHVTNVTKITKNKRQKYGMNETKVTLQSIPTKNNVFES